MCCSARPVVCYGLYVLSPRVCVYRVGDGIK